MRWLVALALAVASTLAQASGGTAEAAGAAIRFVRSHQRCDEKEFLAPWTKEPNWKKRGSFFTVLTPFAKLCLLVRNESMGGQMPPLAQVTQLAAVPDDHAEGRLGRMAARRVSGKPCPQRRQEVAEPQAVDKIQEKRPVVPHEFLGPTVLARLRHEGVPVRRPDGEATAQDPAQVPGGRHVGRVRLPAGGVPAVGATQ